MPSGIRATAVPVQPLAEAFARSGLTTIVVARRLGWASYRHGHGCSVADGTRVQRYLGLRDYSDGSGKRRMRQFVNYETAVQLARAIGVDPVDVGC